MSADIIIPDTFLQYLIGMGTTVVGVLLGFMLFRINDNRNQKKERKGKLKSFVKNLIIEIEYNCRVLEKEPTKQRIANFHYIRDSYFKSSMNSGLFHLIEHEDLQKLLPMHYHELEMYKNTTTRIRAILSLTLQSEYRDMAKYQKHEDEELSIAESIRKRSIKESHYLVKELKKLIFSN